MDLHRYRSLTKIALVTDQSGFREEGKRSIMHDIMYA
jgi:hypothetical protein